MTTVLFDKTGTLTTGKQGLVGMVSETPGQEDALLALAADGRIDPLLHPPYAMADGARAVQDMLERKVTGKVVVRVKG